MSINVSEKGEGKIVVDMDNGHVIALKKIVTDYNLKGESEAINFMLGVISQAGGKPIEINGNKFVPPDAYRKQA